MLSWLDREDYNPQRFEPLRVDPTAYEEPWKPESARHPGVSRPKLKLADPEDFPIG